MTPGPRGHRWRAFALRAAALHGLLIWIRACLPAPPPVPFHPPCLRHGGARRRARDA